MVTRINDRRFVGAPLFIGLVVAVLIGTASPSVPGSSAAAASGGNLRLLGKLPVPKETQITGALGHSVFLVDSVDRRLYYSYTRPFGSSDAFATYIREYDLNSKIPSFLREGRLGSGEEVSAADVSLNSNVAQLDRKRDRLLLLNYSSTPVSCPNDPRCGGTVAAFGRIFVVDRATLRVTDSWVVNDRTPGFFPAGITYSPEDDRIYAVGELATLPGAGPSNLFQGNQPRNLPTAVVAMEPENGTVAWIRLVPECAVAMSTQHIGVAVKRSPLKPVLYFACIRPETSPETGGLMRLWIDPKAGPREAADFPLEVFPISGSYGSGAGVTGFASFDPATERFFMTSQSQSTPGAWVFDGRLSAWAGFVAAPHANNRFAAVDELTGRYYMAGDPSFGQSQETLPGYLLLSEGRQTPVPQGEVFAFDNGAVRAPVYVDPPTRRLFIQRGREDGIFEWLVYKDTKPVAGSPGETDYDSLTTDMDEGPNALTTFAGTVNGFGSRILLTGGTGGAMTVFTGAPTSAGDVANLAIDAFVQGAFRFRPSRGDRGAFAARVTSLDLRNVGASAQAQALSLDHISQGEYETTIRASADRFRSQQEQQEEQRHRDEGRPDDDDEAGDSIERQLAWPHPEAFCLDAGAEKESTSEEETVPSPGASSGVTCDLKTETAKASSSFAALSIEGVSIGRSSFTSEVIRDGKLGIVTKSTATAQGVELLAPGGTVTIARVVATATTRARGRVKTAEAEWKPVVEGVVVRDAAGKVLYECTQGKSCDIRAAVDAMNRVLVTRMRVSLPEPVVTETDGGAFAAVEETEGDFLTGLNTNNDSLRAVPAMTITIYNDWTEKSRLVVQLAAIQASSIYGITPLPGSETGGGDIPIPPLPGGQLPIPPPPVLDGVLPPPAGAPPVGRLVESPLFLIRSPKQAFLFGLTLLLFAGAVAAIWRRRTLIRELNV